VLTNAASSGDLVETISFFVSSVLNAIPAVNNAVTTAYINDGAVTQAKLAAGVAGNGPAFSAFLSAPQTLSNATATVVQNNLENFDTASCYNTSTYAFTPNVAGYYQVTMATNGPGSTTGQISVNLYKNGSAYQQGNAISNASFGANAVGSYLVYLNGSTDYITMVAYQTTGGSGSIYGSSSGIQYTYFSACLARAA
jgi:hypothetical protein